MIISKLIGGLGNQMFQYAAGRSLSLDLQTDFYLDHGFFSEVGNHTPRVYELHIFQTEAKACSPEQLAHFNQRGISSIRNVWSKLTGGEQWQTVREKSHAFMPEVPFLKGNNYLIGYWQSEKYFAGNASQIRKDFSFRIEAEGENARLLDKIRKDEAVSIHIRRGDYVSNPSALAFHGLCGLDYYEAAINSIQREKENLVFYVFSDDIAWARENLRLPGEAHFIDHNKGSKSWEDMRLMSTCKHNIIANSSFSWWGAWLNAHPGKIVLGPKKWFLDESIPVQDVLPDTWRRL